MRFNGGPQNQPLEQPGASRRPIRLLLQTAPFVLATMMILALTYSPDVVPATRYETRIGEQREIWCGRDLITLNTNSSASVRCGGTSVQVRLDKGEASFHVVHDASKTFSVLTDNAQITDLGTIFSVRTDAEKTTVTVFEGRVNLAALAGECPARQVSSSSVSCTTAPANAKLALRAGERAAIVGSKSTTKLQRVPITSEQLTYALEWEHGRLAFSGEPLSTIIDEINRYNTRKLRIVDPAIACRMTGLLGIPATDPEYIARKLQRVGIDSKQEPDGTIDLKGNEPSTERCSQPPADR